MAQNLILFSAQKSIFNDQFDQPSRCGPFSSSYRTSHKCSLARARAKEGSGDKTIYTETAAAVEIQVSRDEAFRLFFVSREIKQRITCASTLISFVRSFVQEQLFRRLI